MQIILNTHMAKPTRQSSVTGGKRRDTRKGGKITPENGEACTSPERRLQLTA